MANTGQTARGQNYRGMLAIQLDDHTANVTNSNLWEYSILAGVPTATNTEAQLAIADSDDAPSGYYISDAAGMGEQLVAINPRVLILVVSALADKASKRPASGRRI